MAIGSANCLDAGTRERRRKQTNNVPSFRRTARIYSQRARESKFNIHKYTPTICGEKKNKEKAASLQRNKRRKGCGVERNSGTSTTKQRQRKTLTKSVKKQSVQNFKETGGRARRNVIFDRVHMVRNMVVLVALSHIVEERRGEANMRETETSDASRTMQKTVRNNSINIPQQFFLSSFPLPLTGEEYSASVTVLSRGASGWRRLCSCLPSAVSKDDGEFDGVQKILEKLAVGNTGGSTGECSRPN